MATRIFQTLEELWTTQTPERGRRVYFHADIDDFRVTLADYHPELDLGPHAYAWSSVEIALAGGGVEAYRSRPRLWEPGRLHTYTAFSEHWTVEQGRPIRVLQVRMPPELLTREREVCIDDLERARLATLLYRLLAEIRAGDTAAPLVLCEICHDLAAPPEPTPDPPAWGERVEQLVRASLDRPASLQEIASEIGVDRCHLARSFRRWRGRSIGQFVRELRLDEAARELARTTTPLKLVALRAGFADQPHFTRQFKRRYGMTPAAFRRCVGSTPIVSTSAGPRRASRGVRAKSSRC